jgi:hypothetical protein
MPTSRQHFSQHFSQHWFLNGPGRVVEQGSQIADCASQRAMPVARAEVAWWGCGQMQ